MTDPVILLGTQSNGETLPVQVDEFGRLVAEGLKGDPGDPGNDGNSATVDAGTTTTGEPGTNAQVSNSGSTQNAVFDFVIPRGLKGDPGDPGEPGADGVGVPQPLGEEGSFLWIKDGAPAWTTGDDPGPPEPGPTTPWLNWEDTQLVNNSNSPIAPPNPYEYGTSLPTWLTVMTWTIEGFRLTNSVSGPTSTNAPKLYLSDQFGKVVRLWFEYMIFSKKSSYNIIPTYYCNADNAYVQKIREDDGCPNSTSDQGYMIPSYHRVDFLINRPDLPEVTFSYGCGMENYSDWVEQLLPMFRGWEIMDPSHYLLRRQAERKQAIDQLLDEQQRVLNPES